MAGEIPSPDMRETILDTAARLFVAQGYAGVSMREIADACGMSKAGLYYHFQDKEQLFFEILTQNLEVLEDIIREAACLPGSARSKISHFIRSVFLHLPTEQRAIIRLANQEMARVGQSGRQAFGERYWAGFIGPLTGLFEAGIRAGEFRAVDPQMAVWGLLGVMYPFLNPEHASPGHSADQNVEFILTVYFEGMGAHG